MADTLTASWSAQLAMTFTKATSQNPIVDQFTTGANGIADLAKNLANGTGAGNARYRYHKQYTTGATTNNDLDLTNLTDDFGVTINFGLIKWFLVRIVTPATGAKLTIGNSGANDFVGWFGAATHTLEVRDQVFMVNQIDGFTVDGTHKILRIRNPGASSVIYDVVIIGE